MSCGSALAFLLSVLLAGGPVIAAEWRAVIGDVVVVTAAGAAPDHTALGASASFRDGIGEIFLSFESTSEASYGSTWIDFSISPVGEDRILVEGYIQVPSGGKNSIAVGTKEFGLAPSEYRLGLESSSEVSDLLFSIEPEKPPALLVGSTSPAGLVLSNTEWSADPRFADWSLPLVPQNIALDALGGRILNSSQSDDSIWARRNLNDGLGSVPSIENSDICVICGWSAAEDDARREIVIGFHEGREAAVGGVVLDTSLQPWKQRPSDHYPKYVEVSAASSPAAAFELIAEAYIPPREGRYLIPLPTGQRAGALKIRIVDTHAGEAPVLAEVEVLESAPLHASITHDLEVDLARAGLGGVLVTFDSYRDHPASNLFTTDDREELWRSFDNGFPQDFTLAFGGDQVALVEKVTLSMPLTEDPETWPSEIAIAVSDEHPIDGYREIARYRLEQRPDAQELKVSAEARFIKIRILNNFDGPYTSLSELAVIEGRSAGYTPLRYRTGLPDAVTHEASRRDTDRLLAPEAPTESEPNDSLDEANRMTEAAAARGSIDPLGEFDFFALPEMPKDARALTLKYSGYPHIRHSLSLLDAAGGVLKHFDPGELPASEARLSFKLTGDETHLKLSEPSASVVVVWDTSGSMHGSEQDLESAVREYVRRAPDDQKIGLIRFSDDVEVVQGSLTSSKPELEGALENKFRPYGSTLFYDAVLKAMELLQHVEGNRAILAMTDGEDNGPTWHGDFWDEIGANRVRLYTIGLGSGLERISLRHGTTGRRALQHLALATDGAAFFTAESSELHKFYRTIGDELSRPAFYSLTPYLEHGLGQLELTASGEQVPSAAMPAVHVILDVSGSMAERLADGRPRMDAAKQAMFATLDALPEAAPFGLTVYGARIPETPDKALACTDIVTVQDLAPLEAEQVKAFVSDLQPRGGTTPLARSIDHVVRDFKGENGGIVVAITDGIEECDPEPLATIEELQKVGLEKIELNVIGFDLQNAGTKQMMQKIAALGGGLYYDASDGEAVAAALTAAMAAPYTVHDATGAEIARGTIGGGSIQVPPGFYRVEIAAANGAIQIQEVEITQDHLTTVHVKKVGSEAEVEVGQPESLTKMRDRQAACGEAATHRNPADRARRVQEKLNQLGFDVGPADNNPGLNTKRGISAFQSRYQLAEPAEITLRLEQHLDCVLGTGVQYQGQSAAISR